jgi:hypothetical protein
MRSHRAPSTIFRAIGFDDRIAELETLLPGDSVAIQGSLEIESKDKKIVSLFIVALQVTALHTRSINRMPGAPAL